MEQPSTQIINDLQQNSEILAQIKSQDHLQLISEILLQKLQQVNLSQINPLVLQYLANNFLSRMFCVMETQQLSPEFLDLIKYLQENKLISPIFQKVLNKCYFSSGQRGRLQSITNLGDEGREQVLGKLQGLLNQIFQINTKAQSKFGYCLINTKGDFVLADVNALQLLGVLFPNDSNLNLFKLLIPQSKSQLQKRLNLSKAEFTQESLKMMQSGSNAFSLVFYSELKAKKYGDFLQQKKIKKQKLHRDPKASKEHFYSQYMQTLNVQMLPINLTGDAEKLNWNQMTCFEYKNIQQASKNLILMKMNLSKSVPKFAFERNQKDELFIKFSAKYEDQSCFK